MCPQLSYSHSFQANCGPNQFFCDEECMDLILLCDGDVDCDDGLDERNCDSKPEPDSPEDLFDDEMNYEDDYNQLPVDYVDEIDYNFEPQQPDRDQNTTQSRQHREDKVPVASLVSCGSTGQQIARKQVCDGKYDCLNRLDEVMCPANCSTDEVRCNSGLTCVKRRKLCDGTYDCDDKSDEVNCVRVGERSGSKFSLSSSLASKCYVTQFTCPTKLYMKSCINFDRVCDRSADCIDRHDELGCGKLVD